MSPVPFPFISNFVRVVVVPVMNRSHEVNDGFSAPCACRRRRPPRARVAGEWSGSQRGRAPACTPASVLECCVCATCPSRCAGVGVAAARAPRTRVAVVVPRPGRAGAVGGTTALAVARRGPGGPRSRARAISLRLRYRLSPDRSRLISMTPRSPTGQRQSDNRHTSAAFRSNDNIEHSQVAGCRAPSGAARQSFASPLRTSR